MASEPEWVILDTSVLVAFFTDEAGAKLVAVHRARLAIPFVTLTEMVYILWRRFGEEAAMAQYTLVTKWGRPLLWPDETILLLAARLRTQYHLGLADSYIAAFAKHHGAPLLTNDRDYRQLGAELTLIEP